MMQMGLRRIAALKFRFYIHGETATSGKNVQSEVGEVEKVLHTHTHPEPSQS